MNRARHLKKSGLKVTMPRLKILHLFDTSDIRHLSADDIHKKILEDDLDISLATIYRVLTQLEEAGILVKHHFEGGAALFELNNKEHHDHIVCLDCGYVEEFFDERIEAIQERIIAERGYNLKDHDLHLYVDCCKQNCPHKKS